MLWNKFRNDRCCAGLTIKDFNSTISALWVSDGATVTLVNTHISDCSINGFFGNSAVVSVNAVQTRSTYFAQQQDTILRLKRCTLTNLAASHELVEFVSDPFRAYDARVYSDEARVIYRVTGDTHRQLTEKVSTKWLSEAPADRPGIDAVIHWLDSNEVEGVRTTLLN